MITTIERNEVKIGALEAVYGSCGEAISQDEVDPCLFTILDKNEEYLVLTDEEADKRARDYIKESLWAFTPHFIADWVDSVDSMTLRDRDTFIESLAIMQGKMCEGCNGVVAALIGNNFDDFVDAAIEADGRGHFLSQYDSKEHEIRFNDELFYIYRVN